jgi:hypothetical protein
LPIEKMLSIGQMLLIGRMLLILPAPAVGAAPHDTIYTQLCMEIGEVAKMQLLIETNKSI